MLFADGALGLALLVVWVFCIFEAITTDPARVRNLPKLAWVIVVIVLVDIGSILWLFAGRPRGAKVASPSSDGRIPPEYDRPGRAAAANPDDDAAFLAALKARAEEQRARAAEQDKADGAGEDRAG